uniref:UPAR/Ly6 domain-containing protein n=1 Tax=Oryzias latipes TaxID=8090 RepID=A0A3B3H4Y2_ORYLA
MVNAPVSVSAESLVCNKCSFSVFGVCLNSGNVTCSNIFPSLTSFSGFNNQGCQDTTTGCNATTSASLLGVTYNTTISCCSSDKCNPALSPAAPTRASATPEKQVRLHTTIAQCINSTVGHW